MKQSRLFLLLISLCTLIYCSEPESPREFGREYYPISIGSNWVYEVDNIHFDPFTESSDTFQFLIKRTVNSILNQDENSTQYLLEIEKLDSNDVWEFDSYQKAEKTDIKVVENINNIDIVKLVFPISERKSWDANISNTNGEDIFRYRNVDQNITILNGQSLNGFKVEQEKDSNFFQFVDRHEIFAEGVGMVKKVNHKTEIQFDIKEGFHETWTLIDYNP